jgi:hypothetical protein
MREQCAAYLGSIEEFVSGSGLPEIDNGQTRRLAGENPPFGGCSEALLDRAKVNLRERFLVVGLTERYDETLLLLSRALGWRAIFYYKRRNVTADQSTDSPLSDRALQLIEERNRLDAELYRFAQQLFEEQVRRQGAELDAELSLFRSINGQLTSRAARPREAVFREGNGRVQVAESQAGVEVPPMLLDAYIHLLRRGIQLQKDLARKQEESQRGEREIRALRKRLDRAQERPAPVPAGLLGSRGIGRGSIGRLMRLVWPRQLAARIRPGALKLGRGSETVQK